MFRNNDPEVSGIVDIDSFFSIFKFSAFFCIEWKSLVKKTLCEVLLANKLLNSV